uniref:Uncharacterized protein n=1 Tax=Timema bartmani TaxID=61472 RepID=A0A7R9FBZ2_9NEOP|nr:unnamed protein product [Timema bartmani]
MRVFTDNFSPKLELDADFPHQVRLLILVVSAATIVLIRNCSTSVGWVYTYDLTPPPYPSSPEPCLELASPATWCDIALYLLHLRGRVSRTVHTGGCVVGNEKTRERRREFLIRTTVSVPKRSTVRLLSNRGGWHNTPGQFLGQYLKSSNSPPRRVG